MSFILYNEQLKKPLKHPKVGIWSTENKQEAEDMHQACKEYMEAIGVSGLFQFIKIKETT